MTIEKKFSIFFTYTFMLKLVTLLLSFNTLI